MKLPLNCEVSYHSDFLDATRSQQLFEHLMGFEELTSPHKVTMATGNTLAFDHGKMMFIDEQLLANNALPEEIWGHSKVWTPLMAKLKTEVEQLSGHSFGVCVAIYYADGNVGVGYHSDPPAFGDTQCIPSLSLGEERMFNLREKTTTKEYSLLLEQGSLLVMGDQCQQRYEHALPTDTAYTQPRINLTFRQYGFS